MGKVNKNKSVPRLKYKRTFAFENLINTIDHHETALNKQTENALNSEDEALEIREKAEETRVNVIELAKDAKLFRQKIMKKNFFIYFFAIITLTLVITLSIISISKFFYRDKSLNIYISQKNNSKSSVLLDKIATAHDYESHQIPVSSGKSPKYISYEYDYCTDYPLDNSQRAFYYFLSVLFTILSLLLLIGSVCVNRAYSNALCGLISENFQIKYEICFHELKLLQIIESVVDE